MEGTDQQLHESSSRCDIELRFYQAPEISVKIKVLSKVYIFLFLLSMRFDINSKTRYFLAHSI